MRAFNLIFRLYGKEIDVRRQNIIFTFDCLERNEKPKSLKFPLVSENIFSFGFSFFFF